MDGRMLAKMFRVSHGALLMNLEGIDHERSLVQPSPAGNCINWVLAHIIASRDQLFGLLGLEPALGEAGKRYRRSSEPVRGAEEALPFADLIGALERSQERLVSALSEIPDERLADPFDGARYPGRPTHVGDLLLFVHFHETYHVGQVGLLRRLAGMEGAIR